MLPLDLRSVLSRPTTLPSAPALPTRKLFSWIDPTTLRFRIDWSSIEGFLHCNRLAKYRLVDSRIPHPGIALVFGAAMHAALEVWYKHYNNTFPDAAKLQEILLLCKTAIDQAFAEHPSSTMGQDYRTSDYCYTCFLQYISHPEIKDERMKPAELDGQQLVEFSFSLPLDTAEVDPRVFTHYGYGVLTDNAELEQSAAAAFKDLPCVIEWSGIIDMVADSGGEHWLVDHKTTSILSNDFFDSFEIAMQPVGYVSAARQALPHLDIKGFIVNVLACRKPTKTGTAFEPHRRRYQYEQWHFDEWKADALGLIQEFLSNLHSNFFPKKTAWCAGKYGMCRYFPVCSMNPDHRSAILQSGEYVDNTWNPFS